MRNLLTQREVENAIFEGIYPTKTFRCGGLTLIFVISERKFPKTFEGWFDFFEHAIFISGFDDSRIFLKTLPVPLFYKLIRDYKEFYSIWLKSISTYMSDIVDSPESCTTWKVCQKTSMRDVIYVQNRLNAAQYFWVAFNSVQDESDRTKLISNIFDMLKPWLNAELWQRIQEEESGDSRRINRLEEEQINAYEQSLGTSQTSVVDHDEITIG